MHILSIDQSTSSTKAILFDAECKVKGRINIDHEQYYPEPGWVEHDPVEIYNNLKTAVKELISTTGIAVNSIKSLAITNQRETVVVWDKNTGKPVYNAIVWQCARAMKLCDKLDRPEIRAKIREATGLMLSPYFSAAKILWILENVEGARARAENGELLCGTIDSWLIWNLTDGALHATDYSNASRMSLLNLDTLEWDKDICHIFNIPVLMLPDIICSDEIWAETDLQGILEKPLPISGVLGDSHAALFAQQCYNPGMAKATYGTGSSIMMNVGSKRIQGVDGLVSSIGWRLRDEVVHVLEGNINCTGATIKWLADNLQILDNPSAAEKFATEVADTGGVYFVPAFSGLSAPYWDNEVRAMIDGISFSTTKSHIIRAALEAIAYQITDVVSLMTKGSGLKLSHLRTDGGPTRNKFLMQFQADIAQCTVVPARIEELSALGVAMIGGLRCGVWQDRKVFSDIFEASQTFSPSISNTELTQLKTGWKNAVSKARG